VNQAFHIAAVIGRLSVAWLLGGAAFETPTTEQLQELKLRTEVRILVNRPKDIDAAKPTLLVIYVLPNGNTIEETVGRRPRTSVEWRFDIQHIAAQTRLLRETRTGENLVIAYLEAQGLSWPKWRWQHANASLQIRDLIADILRRVGGRRVRAALVAHSGGGSLIFGLLDSAEALPGAIDRIVLLDADYDYSDEAHHGEKLLAWLHGNPARKLVVLAYDDRTVTLDGKPIVSPTGGTYSATYRMLARFQKSLEMTRYLVHEFDGYVDRDRQAAVCVNRNYANRILHSAMVGEMNGFL